MIESEARGGTSVAMCTYNGERYLQEQLDTIAAQTRRPSELVICDDRSTDRTVEILEAFAKVAPFPVYIHRNSEQLRSTRNFDKAIRLCQGDYVALSDQDDRWKPHKLERLCGMLDEDPEAGMVFSDAALIDGASNLTGARLWESLRFGPRVRALFDANPGRVLLERPVVTGATVVFRRSLLEHFADIPPNWVHDGWIAWMSVVWAKPRTTDETLTEYRIHVAQQLGVGKTSFFARMGKIRSNQRVVYAGVAEEFESLLGYIDQCPTAIRSRWHGEVAKAIVFLNERAYAPTTVTGRLVFLLNHLNMYNNLSGPSWRSLLRDLVMGPMEIR